jgi:8-oxo-dGTP pyrophosphatase MutT (NUDIX family)
MSAALILPYKQERGRDSSRLILIGNVIGRGSPVVLCTKEYDGDSLTLRLPGGIAHRGEKPMECAHRERIEETGLRLNDLDTELNFASVRRGKSYDVYVFYGAMARKIPLRYLEPEDDKIVGLKWIYLEDLLRKGAPFRSSEGLMLQETHHKHLRELFKNHPNIITELKSWISVQQKTKSAP